MATKEGGKSPMATEEGGKKPHGHRAIWRRMHRREGNGELHVPSHSDRGEGGGKRRDGCRMTDDDGELFYSSRAVVYRNSSAEIGKTAP